MPSISPTPLKEKTYNISIEQPDYGKEIHYDVASREEMMNMINKLKKNNMQSERRYRKEIEDLKFKL